MIHTPFQRIRQAVANCVVRHDEGQRRGRRQRDGAAVEHDADRRHVVPMLWVFLDAEQPYMDAPQQLLRPAPVGQARAAIEQPRHTPTAPVPPNLSMHG